MQIPELISIIKSRAFEVRKHLSSGFLEKVYQNALLWELHDAGLKVSHEYPINVVYKGHIVGDYVADIFVEGKIIIELKAVSTLLPNHELQLVNYLTATGIDDGILINYGNQYSFRHKTRLYSRPTV